MVQFLVQAGLANGEKSEFNLQTGTGKTALMLCVQTKYLEGI